MSGPLIEADVDWGAFEQPAKTAGMNGLQANPVQSAEAIQIGKKLDTPPMVVETDPEFFKQQVKAKEFQAAIADNIEIQNYVTSTPEAAKVSNSDWPRLSKFSEALKGLYTTFEAVGDSFRGDFKKGLDALEEEPGQQLKAGGLQYERGALGAGKVVTDQLGRPMEEDSAKRLKQIEEELKGIKPPSGLIGEASNMIGQLLPSIGPTFAGAAVGSVAPGIGTGAGALTAFSIDQGRTAAGNMYLNNQQAGLDPIANLVTSIGYGTVVAAINSVGIGSLSKGAKLAIDSVAGTLATRLAADKTVAAGLSTAVTEAARGGLVFGSLGAIQSFAETFGTDIAKTFSKMTDGRDFETIFNESSERDMMIDKMFETFKSAAVLGGMMHVLPIGVSAMADKMHRDAAITQAKRLDDIMRARDQTETHRLAPALIDDFVQQHNLNDFGLDPSAVRPIFEKDPAAFSFIPDFLRKMDEAERSGDMIPVSPGQYLAHISPDMHFVLKDDISINDGMTVNQAKVLGENPPNYEAGIEGKLKPQEPDAVEPGKVSEPLPQVPAVIEPVPGKAVLGNREALGTYREVTNDVAVLAEAQARGAGLNGLFEDAKAAGMTKPEYALYQRRLAEAQQKLTDKAAKAGLKEAEKRLTQKWKEDTEVMRREVQAEMIREPDYSAITYMKLRQEGSAMAQALDEAMVRAILNEDVIPRGLTTKKGGMDPQDMAELNGFKTAEEFLKSIKRSDNDRILANDNWSQYRDRKLSEETARRMEAKYGKLRENIEAASYEAGLNAKQIDVLSVELETLARLTGIERAFTKADLESAVKAVHASRIVGKDSVKQYQRAAGLAARKAELMNLRGKHAEAYLAKQRQMIMVRLAQEAIKEDKARAKFDRMIKPFITKLSVDGVPQAYTDTVQLTLNGYFDIPIKRDINELLRGNPKSVPDFTADLRTKGDQILVPGWMLDPDWALRNDRSLKSLTIDQYRDVQQFVTELVHLGKAEETITAKGEAKKLAEITSAAATQVRELGDRYGVKGRVADKVLDESLAASAKSAGRQWDAGLLRMERLMSWLDGRDSNGLFNTYAFRELVNAQNSAATFRAGIAKKFRELPEIKDADVRVPNDIFRDPDGHILPMTRQRMVMVMLNMGNESNMSVLARGYGLERSQIEAWVRTFARKDDWTLVKGIWDIFENDLFPLTEANSRELLGVGLKKIEPREIDTAFGKITGGYFPLIEALDRLAPRDAKTLDPFKGTPMPTRGYMEYRTGMAYPVSLEFTSIARAMNEQIHSSFFSVPLQNTRKFLNDREIRKAIRDVFGQEYVAKIDPWLDFIATDGGKFEPINDRPAVAVSKFLRQNAATVLVGFKPGTAVIHGLGAYFNSVQEAGAKAFHKEAGEMIGEMLGFRTAAADLMGRSEGSKERITAWVQEQSPFMANRKRNLDRDINMMLTDTFETGLKGKYFKARALQAQWAGFMIANLDQMSAYPTWVAGYRQALANNMSHADAVYHADQITRNAHGSTGIVDAPSFFRGKGWEGEAKGWVTLFGTYWNHAWNQMRDKQRVAVEGLYDKDFMAFLGGVGGVIGYVLANTLSHELTRSKGTLNEEDGAMGYVNFVAHGIATTLYSTQPIIRDIGFAWDTGKLKSNAYGQGVDLASAMDQSLTTITKGLLELYDVAIEGEDVSIDNLANALAAPAWAVGLGPTAYMVRLSKYAFGDGRAVDTPWEAWRLMLDAQLPPKKRKKSK